MEGGATALRRAREGGVRLEVGGWGGARPAEEGGPQPRGRGWEVGAYRGEQRQREAGAELPQHERADAERRHCVSGRRELQAQRDSGVQPHGRAVACQLHKYGAASARRARAGAGSRREKRRERPVLSKGARVAGVAVTGQSVRGVGGGAEHGAHLLSIQLCSCRKPSCARLSSRLGPSSCT